MSSRSPLPSNLELEVSVLRQQVVSLEAKCQTLQTNLLATIAFVNEMANALMAADAEPINGPETDDETTGA